MITSIKALILTLLIGISTLHAQTFQWAKSIGGASSDIGNSVAVDAAGNVFTTGYFANVVDFDPGVGTFNLSSMGSTDIFVQKLNASGNFVWAKSFGGVSGDRGQSVIVDDSGNVYITGYFLGTVDFDPGSGVVNRTAAGEDAFILKLDASGHFVWVKSFGGEGISITVDGLGNVYTTGVFYGTIDFNPDSSGTFNITSAGQADIFVHKLDASGNFVWAKSFGGALTDHANSITLDGSGNVYTTGYFAGVADFNPGLSGTFNLSSAGNDDMFIQKIDSSGNFLWAKSFGGASYDYSNSIATDVSGNVYTTGYFVDTVDFDPGSGVSNLISAGSWDIYVQKLDGTGNFIWAKSIGGTSIDYGNSIDVDALGNVYTTGLFTGTIDFDPGVGTLNLISAGSWDIYVQKLDGSGSFLGAKSFGGTSLDFGNSITVDASGNVYTTGAFRGVADFDPGTGIFNLTSGGFNDDDVFVQKMDMTTTSIREFTQEVQITVYPNPTTGSVQLTMEKTMQYVELTLTDLQGKEILTQACGELANTNIELPNAKGIYFLTIRTRETQSVLKLIKQ